MRIHRLSVALLLLLEAWPSDAFVPSHFAPRSTQLWSSSVDAAEIADSYNELPDGSILEDVLCPDPLEYTNRILDTENNPPGSLTWDSVRYAVPLLVSWGKTETSEGAITVETLLDRLEAEVEAGNKLIKLSNKHYTLAIDAWGKSGREDSAENAERILLKMKEMEKLHIRFAPNRFTYNAVMNAHAKQGHTKRAAELLVVMENDANLELTAHDYNVLLGAYARVGEARKAEDVLKRMVERCKEKGDPCGSAPDITSYNMLLDAWAKSNEKGRGQRAESILEALQREYDNGEFAFEPDARTYAAAIFAIVRSNEPLAIERAEKIVETALSRGFAHDEYLHTALLDAYATSPQPGFAEKAQQLLDKLEGEGVANAVTYNTVLKAWKGNNMNDESLKRMEDLLCRMEELRFADTISYSTVIAAYANKGNIASAQRAEEILLRMPDAGAKPNTQTLNAGTFFSLFLFAAIYHHQDAHLS
jgi:pentatricopeptide repeat protein